MNWQRMITAAVCLLACVACNRFEPREHVAEIEDIIRYKSAIVSLCDHYYIDTRILGNLLLRIDQQTHCETYWQRMEYIKLFKVEEYFPKKSENQYLSILNGLMEQYRDTEIVLGPIEKNYRNGLSTYYMVEDRLSGMRYYIEYRRSSVWSKKGELNITSKKEKCAIYMKM
ncbi:hypothetical protein [uncultured Alistipes sp.]|uniref:hypothetical protein n=1 Tax=uncultured Alistipes sp. TaxID=538949 RepID=UPI0026651E33|nr:hypothetical protein [uncultured Alistipes sp.]